MKDLFGREIDYLRVSLTDRCNLRCIYCMPKEGIDKLKHEDILSYEEVLKIIKMGTNLGIKKIRFTGGEPLILKDIESLIAETHKINGIEEISLTTNGILLYDKAQKLKEAGINRINISLDTLNEEKYKKITRGGDINKVLKAIYKCIEVGMEPVKINTVLIKGINDDEIEDFMNLTLKYPIHVRFIEIMPLGEGKRFYEDGKLSGEEVIDLHPNLEPIDYGEKGVAKMYMLPGGLGEIGFINPMSCKFCSQCSRLRLTSTGKLKPCLHSKEEYDIRKFINNPKALEREMRRAIFGKPYEHHLVEEYSNTPRMMYEIGG